MEPKGNHPVKPKGIWFDGRRQGHSNTFGRTMVMAPPTTGHRTPSGIRRSGKIKEEILSPPSFPPPHPARKTIELEQARGTIPSQPCTATGTVSPNCAPLPPAQDTPNPARKDPGRNPLPDRTASSPTTPPAPRRSILCFYVYVIFVCLL